MSEDTSREPSGKSSSASGQGVLEADRRGAQRRQLSADAEVTDLRSGLKLSARVSDLSLKGCFIDTLNPYPVGTAVSLRLFKGKDVFEARAIVGEGSFPFVAMTGSRASAPERRSSGNPGPLDSSPRDDAPRSPMPRCARR